MRRTQPGPPRSQSEVSPVDAVSTLERVKTHLYNDRRAVFRTRVSDACLTRQHLNTLLHLAAVQDKAWAVPILEAAGADVDALEIGATPLHAACYWGREATALALVDAGADPYARAPNGLTPLDNALWQGHLRLAEALGEHTLSAHHFGSERALARPEGPWFGP